MRLLIALLFILSTNASWANDAVIKDGGTIELSGVIYRLDGVDAPAFDQICLNEFADPWACGVDAREQLSKLVGSRAVHCDDRGPDKTYGKWHVGLCTVESETTSLNQLVVRSGFALGVDPSVKDPFKDDEAAAKDHLQGLWKGCFAAPQDFRRGNKAGTLLGAACRSDKERETRAVLFPAEPTMPSGCAIKGKFAVRAHLTGNLGIYHLRVCRTYETLTKPDRWFCSEDDAQAEGFRKAFNCRPGLRRR